jgi:hypothetical protein
MEPPVNARPEDLAYMDLIDLKELERQAYIDGQRLLGAAVNRIIDEIEAAEEDREALDAAVGAESGLQATYDDLCSMVETVLDLIRVRETEEGEYEYYLYDDGWVLKNLFDERGMNMPKLEVTSE